MKRYLWILLASLVLLAGCKGAGRKKETGHSSTMSITDGTDLVKQEAKAGRRSQRGCLVSFGCPAGEDGYH